ncbi:MAG: EAL domain-containing protein [Solirubrobacterales bacterium]
MIVLGEILRWICYRVSGLYMRFARAVMRRDRLVIGSERKFRALLESAPDATVIVNWHGHIALVNDETEKLFGYSRRELVGKNVAFLVPERFRARHRHHMKNYLRDAERRPMGVNQELYARRRDGSEFPVEIGLSPLGTEQGLLVSAVIRDITERKNDEAKLQHLADHDGLTDLLNRRCFEVHLAREVASAVRYGHEGTMVLIDIDRLKDVNDTLGHAQGDELIKTIAGTIAGRVRETDIVARIGGDEFAILMPHTDAESAQGVAEELLESIREAGVVLGTQRLRPSACAGLAGFEHGRANSNDVMVAADLALYDAKERGRARVAIYVPRPGEGGEREERATWLRRIRHGLDEDLFVPYRQPILDLRTNSISRYELLARLLDEQGRPLPPGAFLATAERSGLVCELDLLMATAAIDLIAENGDAPVAYEVNLSARSLADASLPETLARRIENSGIDPSRLIFEITETAAISNMEQARGFANSLRKIGCQFALDDFGAGFASFLYLKHIPLDALKIDGDFIRKLRSNRTDQLLVKHMAEIARGLNLFTIAEFVEDGETLELLGEYAIDAAQGYFIGYPEPVLEEPALLPPSAPDAVDEGISTAGDAILRSPAGNPRGRARAR